MKDMPHGSDLIRAAFDLDVTPQGGEDPVVELSFSSEKPFLRGGEYEVLGHEPGEVDLARLASGNAPLLKDHSRNIDAMVGRVVSARLDGKRGRAVVRFASTPAAQELLGRVRSKEVRSVSVGYRIHELVRAGERDGREVYRATRWEPYEISLVAVPADDTVGIGRSAGGMGTPETQSETNMNNETPQRPGDVAGATARERTRVAEIDVIASQFNMPRDLVRNAIREGMSVDAFRSLTMDHLANEDTDLTNAHATRAAIHSGRERRYSLTAAINAELSGDWRNAGFEREIGEEMRNIMGRSAEGFYVPPVALAGRDLLTSGNAASLIGTAHLSDGFIDALRPEVQVMALGATVLTGLRENISIPRMPSGTSAEWIAEDAAATESTPVFDAVSLSLKQLSANTRMSRRQLKQSLPGLDLILQNDLRRQIAVAVDAAAINGAGTAVEPLGILGTPGIGSRAIGPDGGWLHWPDVTQLMAEVEGANVPTAQTGFLSNHRVKAAMLATAKHPEGGDTAILTADRDGYWIAGLRAGFTSLVPSNLTKGAGTNLSALIFGNWSDLLIGQWGGIDLIVDDKTEAAKGNVRIVAHSEWDIAVRHPQSFAAISDISNVQP